MLHTPINKCFDFSNFAWRPSSLNSIRPPKFNYPMHYQPLPPTTSCPARDQQQHLAPRSHLLLPPSISFYREDGDISLSGSALNVDAVSEMAASQAELLDDISILDIEECSGLIARYEIVSAADEQQTRLQRFLEDESDSDVRVHSIPATSPPPSSGQNMLDDLQMMEYEESRETKDIRNVVDGGEESIDIVHNDDDSNDDDDDDDDDILSEEDSRNGSLLDQWRKGSVRVGWRRFGNQDVLGNLTEEKRKRKRQVWDLE